VKTNKFVLRKKKVEKIRILLNIVKSNFLLKFQSPCLENNLFLMLETKNLNPKADEKFTKKTCLDSFTLLNRFNYLKVPTVRLLNNLV